VYFIEPIFFTAFLIDKNNFVLYFLYTINNNIGFTFALQFNKLNARSNKKVYYIKIYFISSNLLILWVLSYVIYSDY